MYPTYPGALHTFLPFGFSSWVKTEQKQKFRTTETAKVPFSAMIEASSSLHAALLLSIPFQIHTDILYLQSPKSFSF